MIRLHFAPDNASLIVRLVLEELGVPYDSVLVNRAAQEQQGAGYRALNPAGLIPVLETPDGPLSETGAILLWLADRHGRLAPAPEAAGRGAFLRRLFFVSNTLHPMLRMTFYPGKYVGDDPQAQAALCATLQTPHPVNMSLPGALALLDRDWADDLSVVDCYVACLLRWSALYPVGQAGWFDLADYPALRAMAERLEQRPAVAVARQAEGLGPHPFTAPEYADPPQGSAT